MFGKVNPNRPGTRLTGQRTQVSRPTAEIKNPVVGPKLCRPHGTPPPALVQPQRDQAVQEVVARSDPVEHGADNSRFVRGVGQPRPRLLFHISGNHRQDDMRAQLPVMENRLLGSLKRRSCGLIAAGIEVAVKAREVA